MRLTSNPEGFRNDTGKNGVQPLMSRTANLLFHRHHDHLGRWHPGQPSRCMSQHKAFEGFWNRLQVSIRWYKNTLSLQIPIVTWLLYSIPSLLKGMIMRIFSLVVLPDHSLGTPRLWTCILYHIPHWTAGFFYNDFKSIGFSCTFWETLILPGCNDDSGPCFNHQSACEELIYMIQVEWGSFSYGVCHGVG